MGGYYNFYSTAKIFDTPRTKYRDFEASLAIAHKIPRFLVTFD